MPSNIPGQHRQLRSFDPTFETASYYFRPSLISLLTQVKFCSKSLVSFLCMPSPSSPSLRSLSLSPTTWKMQLQSNSTLLLCSPVPVKLNEARNKHRTADLPHFKLLLALHREPLMWLDNHTAFPQSIHSSAFLVTVLYFSYSPQITNRSFFVLTLILLRK